MDTSWYRDINHFARNTPWLHGFMAYYAGRALAPVGAGLLVLGVLVALAWLVARSHLERMPGAVLSGLAGLAALGVQRLVAPVLGFHQPQVAHAELLLPRTGTYVLPDARTAMAGAVVAGFILARRGWLASVALGAALLLAFSRVYVGTDLPLDVAAGLGFGAALTVVLWPAVGLVAAALPSLASGRLGALVATKRARPRPARQLMALGSARPRLPNGRAMEALRAASEAARHAHRSSLGEGP